MNHGEEPWNLRQTASAGTLIAACSTYGVRNPERTCRSAPNRRPRVSLRPSALSVPPWLRVWPWKPNPAEPVGRNPMRKPALRGDPRRFRCMAVRLQCVRTQCIAIPLLVRPFSFQPRGISKSALRACDLRTTCHFSRPAALIQINAAAASAA